MSLPGADPGFQVRGRTDNTFFGIFRVKNHDFTQKIIFFPILGGGGRGASDIESCEKRGWFFYIYFTTVFI